MFRATVLPTLRSIRPYTTACGMLYPIRCRSVIWWRRNSVIASQWSCDGGTPSLPVGDLVTEELRHCQLVIWWRRNSVIASRWSGDGGTPSLPVGDMVTEELCHCQSMIWWWRNSVIASRWSGDGGTPSPDHRPATYWVQHTTSCSVQSNAPEWGQNCCPKHVELMWIFH